MNIAFWDNQLCERGTSISLYDYAYYNQTILGNKSYIFYDKNNHTTVDKIVEKFKKEFVVHETDNFKEVDDYLLKYNITHIYIIKSGEVDNRLSRIAKNCIHCVFNCLYPHGHVYSSISPYVNGNNGSFPVVPHMINLPKHSRNIRSNLKIPESAVVFGGYGGNHSFNLQFVHMAVYHVAIRNPTIFFLFANFIKFCPDLPNIIHLPMITDADKKVEFINTCDAMIWGRKYGETFGISIGEFSTLNKPVIATKYCGGDLAHVHLLGNKAIWYSNEADLTNILTNFDPNVEREKDWNAYTEYTPEKVIRIFNDVYLQTVAPF